MTVNRRSTAARLLLVLLLILPQPLAPAVIVADGAVCTLISAIEAANTDSITDGCFTGSGADTIWLGYSPVLTLVDNDEIWSNGPNGLPSVTTEITVEGNGETISRDPGGSPLFRIFHVGSAGDLTLRNLTIATGITDEDGGGIYNRGRLVLVNTTVNGNWAVGPIARGGGIFNFGSAILRDSTITNNVVWDRTPAPGGGFYGHATGGGIHSHGVADLVIENSTVTLNSALGGDASPYDYASGGGIRSAGPLTVSYSTIAGNTTDAYTCAGGGISLGPVTASIRNSTISSNDAVARGAYAFAGGGGINGGTITLVNSTVTGNSAKFGGGVNTRGTVDHSTFLGNDATVRGSSLRGLDPGLSVIGSIFAARIGDEHCAGNVTDGGGANLADDATCHPAFGTLTGISPLLIDNGGPTSTHRLIPGSTAIDPLAGGCGLGTDQRGAARAGSCDSGAFEDLGSCELQEYESMTVSDFSFSIAYHTALVKPDVVIEDPLGD